MSETGVAAGVRRIEAVTGPRAYELVQREAATLQKIAGMLQGAPAAAVKRVETLLEERRSLEKRLDEALRAAGASGFSS